MNSIRPIFKSFTCKTWVEIIKRYVQINLIYVQTVLDKFRCRINRGTTKALQFINVEIIHLSRSLFLNCNRLGACPFYNSFLRGSSRRVQPKCEMETVSDPSRATYQSHVLTERQQCRSFHLQQGQTQVLATKYQLF